MSIRIDNITRGRFGNKILQYNSLMQLSKNLGLDPSCCNYPDQKFFQKVCGYKKSSREVKLLMYSTVLNKNNNELRKLFETSDLKIDDPAYLLHNVFYKITQTNPREFLKLKNEYKVKLASDKIHVGIHIRGGDRKRQQSRELHYDDYYKRAINHLLNVEDKNNLTFHICTDDNTFIVFRNVVNYCKNKKLNYLLSKDTKINNNDVDSRLNYIYDFSTLAECDYIIAGASTFPICAYFLEKENKKLILSKSWINRNIKHEKWGHDGMPKQYWYSYDNFWINIANGNNKYLKAWLVI